MKRSDRHNIVPSGLASVLLWLTPLALTVPNVALDITEISYTWLDRAVNIALPLGLWLLICSLPRRTGVAALCLMPVMVLCAFQIVLLFLYGESIIAVDMFLNVMTTNAHEAGELLCNLGNAILCVCLIYIPVIAIATVCTARGLSASPANRSAGLIAGVVAATAGAALMVYGLCAASYSPQRRLFPANVICNIGTACRRTALVENYPASSAAYRFGAEADSTDAVFVLVIGETSRADNWQLNGYVRPTNPRLSRRSGLVSFTKALSESNTTHKSVPLMMTALDCSTFGNSIYGCKGVIDAFAEAGYATTWISGQQRNGQLIDFMGSRADSVLFLTDDGAAHHDMELCPLLANAISEAGGRGMLAVVHTYGSHFDYKERYPAPYARFGDEPNTEAVAENRPSLIDSYDNTIVYTDAVLDSIISTLESCRRPAAMLYLADHGEDIFDDSRERFLHASPTPTYWQLHVPMILWMSESYRAANPEKYAAAMAARTLDVSSSRSAFHTMLSLAGIRATCYRADAALTERAYRKPRRLYLDDYNDAVPLRASGMREPDFAMLRRKGISVD